jgi:hypothetical protein
MDAMNGRVAVTEDACHGAARLANRMQGEVAADVTDQKMGNGAGKRQGDCLHSEASWPS